MRVLAGVATLVLLNFAGASVIAPTEAADFHQDQVEAEVLKVMETWIDGFRTLDLDQVIGTVHPDLATIPFGGRIEDRAGYRDAVGTWMETKASWKGGWVDTHVRVLSPDIAVFSGTYEDVTEWTDGRALSFPNNAFAALVERTREGWKISVAGNSSPAGQPVTEG